LMVKKHSKLKRWSLRFTNQVKRTNEFFYKQKDRIWSNPHQVDNLKKQYCQRVPILNRCALFEFA
jgi:hypothetical protein